MKLRNDGVLKASTKFQLPPLAVCRYFVRYDCGMISKQIKEVLNKPDILLII